MAGKVKRNVKRAPGRHAIMRSYNDRAWYELPDWAGIWISDNAWFAAGIYAAFLAPATLLGIVLGAHELPIWYLGIPAANQLLSPTDNGAGLAALVLIINFFFIASAIRPLRRLKHKGWVLVIVAAAIHLIHSIILQHAVTATIFLAIVVYCYFQVRHRLT